MKGRERKTGDRKTAGGGKRKAVAKKKTARSPNRPRSGATAGVTDAGKRNGKTPSRAAGKEGVGSGARRSARRGVRKPMASRKPRKSVAKQVLTTPPVEKVREETRVLGEREFAWVEPESQYRLPDSYGQDRIVAMPRDPYWIHVYWEITEATLSRAVQSLGGPEQNVCRILRVYKTGVAGAGSDKVLFDIPLTPETRNWYINVGGPGRTYRVDIGLLATGGRFVCLARSNVVTTPLDRMSDVLDEKWMSLSPDYEEMYALSGGLARGVSSPELHERLARELEARLASPISSPGMRDVGGEKEMAKAFWFTVDTDLIVYGATVPGSTLNVNGEDWHLRDDGTFSFRCHFPNGAKEMRVSARSAKGAGNEHAELKVNRVTKQTRD